MQHIVHIFIGDELVSFRDKFAAYFRTSSDRIAPPYFTALSLTKKDDNQLDLRCDEKGDREDSFCIDCNESAKTSLTNYLESLFQRKVTIEHPGNHTLVIELWILSFTERHMDTIEMLIDVVNRCDSKISIEVSCFTNRAVSCFIPRPEERLAPDIYNAAFKENLNRLLIKRPMMSALRLIEDRNRNGVSLNFNEDSLALVCAEFSALLCRNYLNLYKTVEEANTPCESFGLSAIKFDRKYFNDYIRNKVIISTLKAQDIDNREFNINALASSTNPIINNIINQIRNIKADADNVKACLSLTGTPTVSDIAGKIDDKIDSVCNSLYNQIIDLLNSDNISFFQREALLSLILGDDCSMFTSSAVQANELIINDLIDDSMRFFTNLDPDEETLKKINTNDIKDVRNRMRNIAIANRQRQKRIEKLNIIKDTGSHKAHIEGNRYQFDGRHYSIGLDIDSEPMGVIYKGHPVNSNSIDLRKNFLGIRDQGGQGSCAAFAIASVIEALCNNKKIYSPAYLYYNARKLQNATNSDIGTSIYHILKVAMQNGVCEESFMPYIPEIFDSQPSNDATENAVNCKVLDAQSIDIKDDKFLDTMKSALCDGFPIIIASRIFDSFTETRSGFIKHPTKKEINVDSGGKHGKHAMVVCGFSDDKKVFVVRNSWGNDFGDNGYCYIPYSYAKKYFLQACIITNISTIGKIAPEYTHNTLNFDESDAKIEAAILQNLIDEDQLELSELARVSNNMKRKWSQNEACLGNANVQQDLLDFGNKGSDLQIEEAIVKNNELLDKYDHKNREFKRNYFIKVGLCCLVTILCVVSVCMFHDNIITWIAAILSLIVSSGIALHYGYAWRNYRQELRDEIERQSNKIDRLHEEKHQFQIKAHIHGSIIRKFGSLRVKLQNENQKLQAFNVELVKSHEITTKYMKKMSPSMPYPFLSVITNESIDRYYNARENKMMTAFDLKALFENFNLTRNFIDQITNDSRITNALSHDVNKFNMSLLINKEDNNRWQFLPDRINLENIIMELINRAIPFSSYSASFYNDGRFIFFHGANDDKINPIKRCFDQAPVPVDDIENDSITILHVCKYNIDGNYY